MSKEQTDWVMVPREPTPEMVAAGARRVSYDSPQMARNCYEAMLAAAPVPAEAQAVAWAYPSEIALMQAGKMATVYGSKAETPHPEIPLYLHPASPSPAGGVQAVTDEMVKHLAAIEEIARDLRIVDRELADHGYATIGTLRATVLGTIAKIDAALSSQAQTTGGVE